MLRSWCNNAEATALLDWAPQVSLESGILRTAVSMVPAVPAASPLANSAPFTTATAAAAQTA